MTYLSARVHVSARVANGDGTDDLAVVEGVDLSSVTGNPGPNEGIGREGNRLHLSVSTHVERVGPETIPQPSGVRFNKI